MSSIGERLRLLRESKGLSQTEVAKLLGVNRTTYVHYETGYSKPTQKLKELCSLFNTTSDYIMGTDRNDTAINVSLNTTDLTEHEHKLIKKYRELSEAAKIRVEARIDAEYDMMKEVEQEKTKDA